MNSLNYICRGVQKSCRSRNGHQKQSSTSYSTSNRHFYLQLLWLATIFCCLGSMNCSESSVTNTTAAPFNTYECADSMESYAQTQYVCYNNQKLYPILKYAENLSRHWCEENFKHEVWNCSGFSVLKEPLIARNSRSFNRELAYVHSVSYAGIALSVAQACSTSYPDHKTLCQCPRGVNCYNNLAYAFEIAGTFLVKRYSGALTSSLNLIHRNYEATKEIIQSKVNRTDVTCRCHGVSGSCTLKTCNSPILPDLQDVAQSLREAYDNACQVEFRGTSRIAWDPVCNRELTKTDLIYFGKRGVNWCQPNRYGGLGTSGRNCSSNSDAPNSCQKLCTSCGRTFREFQVERESRCNCKFVFCCHITCETCKGTYTQYSCS